MRHKAAVVMLLVFGLGVTASAFAGDNWDYRDTDRDNKYLKNEYRDIKRDQRDLNHDYNKLAKDERRGNWRAAQRDQWDIQHDRRDLHNDYRDIHQDRIRNYRNHDYGY